MCFVFGEIRGIFMGVLLSLLTGSLSRLYALVAGLAILVYSFLVNRNSKLKCANENLTRNIDEIRNETDKIVTIQKQQAEIASDPVPDRVELYKRMRKLSERINSKP